MDEMRREKVFGRQSTQHKMSSNMISETQVIIMR